MEFAASLNIWTLFVCIAFGTLLYSYAFFRIWGTHPSLNGAGSFALAFLVCTISCVLTTLYNDDNVKTTFFNTALGDSLVLATYAFLLTGIEQFFSTRRLIPLAWLLASIGFVLTTYFTCVHDSLAARLLIHGVFNAVFRITIGVELLRKPRRTHVRTLACLMLVFAAISIFGIGDILVHPIPQDSTVWMRSSQGLQAVAIFLQFVFVLSTGQLLFLLLNGELLLEVEMEASRDFLTGTLNRRGATEALATEILRAKRSRQPLTVSLIDLDQFKRFNDTMGHAGGDKALIFVASAIKHFIRVTDAVGRFGGDEFIVILPNAAAADVLRVMERIHQEASKFTAPVPLTLSVGIASLVPDDTPATLTARVDEALYDAKQSGRNCSRLHPLEGAAASDHAIQSYPEARVSNDQSLIPKLSA